MEIVGLSSKEVAERVARGAVNRPPFDNRREYAAIAARNLFTLFNALVVPAAAALFWLGDLRGAWAVSAMAVANSTIGLVQEIIAKRRLAALELLTQAKATVVRAGVATTVPTGEVVQDDCVLVAAGDPIIADGTLITADNFEIDEALLTGESAPLHRGVGERVLSGSHCVAGEGVYRTDRVGADSFANQTAAEARQYRFTQSPMQQTLDALIRALTALAVALCGFYTLLFWTRGFPAADLWQMIAATVTSMVPQGLALTTTLALSLAALRISRRGAIVQRLNAVESMAAVSVLCADKTGTLTTGRLSVAQLVPTGPHGNAEEMKQALELFAWGANDLRNKSLLALRKELPRAKGNPSPIVVEQLPFKSQNRFSAVRLEVDGQSQTFVLGSFEALRPCMTASDAANCTATWNRLLPSGLRLLMFAEGEKGTGERPLNEGLAGRALRSIGFVALADELRTNAPAVLAALKQAGIELKVLSGDHPQTVQATIAALHLNLEAGPMVSGDQYDVDQLAAMAESHAVFGRVTPRQKLAIVSALQAKGRRVAMLGDGINDILSIKRSDLGIAMGDGGAATKAVAGLVLENNDFALLPTALAEGRLLTGNLRIASKLFLLKNAYTLLLVVSSLGVFRLGFPYLPQQVTLLNALTIGGPALLIMMRRNAATDGLMPGTTTPQPAFLTEVGRFAVVAGLIVATAGLGLWLWVANARRLDLAAQRSMLVSLLATVGLAVAARLCHGFRPLRIWLIVAAATYLSAMYLPSLSYFFALSPLNALQWMETGLAAAFAAAAFAIVEACMPQWRLSGR